MKDSHLYRDGQMRVPVPGWPGKQVSVPGFCRNFSLARFSVKFALDDEVVEEGYDEL
jgi:hypothetical protein